MKTLTIRDIRLNGLPRRKRFDPAAHLRLLKQRWAGQSIGPSTDGMLALDRRG